MGMALTKDEVLDLCKKIAQAEIALNTAIDNLLIAMGVTKKEASKDE